MIELRLAEILKAKRIDNMSRLALDIGISRNALNRLVKKGELFRIEMESLEKLCRQLNVMPNDLFNIVNEDGSIWEAKESTPPSD